VVVGVELDEKSSTGGDIPVGGMAMESTGSIDDRLGRIEALLGVLVEQRTVKDWYSTAEVGAILSKSGYTVREWCRQGRVRASKRPVGLGPTYEWIVSQEELTLLSNEELPPVLTLSIRCALPRADRGYGSSPSCPDRKANRRFQVFGFRTMQGLPRTSRPRRTAV
jgi:hypothetical protein